MKRNKLIFADAHIYDRLGSVKHILKDIKSMNNWNRINAILSKTDLRNISYYGRDCYSPFIMFKILLVQLIYGYSDREMESQMLFNTLYMWCCELSFDSPMPDHVTIHRWRERFIEQGIYEAVFEDFNLQIIYILYSIKCLNFKIQLFNIIYF